MFGKREGQKQLIAHFFLGMLHFLFDIEANTLYWMLDRTYQCVTAADRTVKQVKVLSVERLGGRC